MWYGPKLEKWIGQNRVIYGVWIGQNRVIYGVWINVKSNLNMCVAAGSTLELVPRARA